jgi:PIN domain nuclease of toxin-antitoxin system
MHSFGSFNTILASAKAVIDLNEDINHEKFASIASIGEIAIKVSIGKLDITLPFDQLLENLVYGNGFEILPITFEHTVSVSDLLFHHKDPFDRLLIAQSLTENMPILSIETSFDAYGVQRNW